MPREGLVTCDGLLVLLVVLCTSSSTPQSAKLASVESLAFPRKRQTVRGDDIDQVAIN